MGDHGTYEKIELDTIVIVSNDQASADFGGEAAILNLKSGVYYELNPVGARIWKLVQTPLTVREVRDTLLDELAQHGLIDIVDNV